MTTLSTRVTSRTLSAQILTTSFLGAFGEFSGALGAIETCIVVLLYLVSHAYQRVTGDRKALRQHRVP